MPSKEGAFAVKVHVELPNVPLLEHDKVYLERTFVVWADVANKDTRELGYSASRVSRSISNLPLPC
jgi:hypothetical protein